MTEKQTLKVIDRIKDSLIAKDYKKAIIGSKNLIDKLVLDSHFWIFKRKLIKKPLIPIRQIESILALTDKQPELKKIINKKTIKQTLKWYSKYEIYLTDPLSKPAKNPAKFAKKTFHVLTLLNLSALKIKSNFYK